MNKALKLLKFIEELLEVPHSALIGHVHKSLVTEAKSNLSDLNDIHKIRASKQALEHYNGDSNSLNKPLREDRKSRIEKVNNHIENMGQVTRQPTKNSFITYRGSTNIDHSGLKKGDIIHDKGFTSTSLEPNTANMFAHAHHEGNADNPHLFRIHNLIGTKGHYISAHDEDLENTDEKEFVLHRGTKFKVGDTNSMKLSGKVHPITDLPIHSQEE